MALPAAGQPISMSMINVELGDGIFDTIDLKARYQKHLEKLHLSEWTNSQDYHFQMLHQHLQPT